MDLGREIPWKRSGLLTPVYLGFPCGSAGKESTCNAGDLGWEDPVENGKDTHSSILAWRIPWTVFLENSMESPLGSQRDWTESLSLFFQPVHIGPASESAVGWVPAT